MPIFFRSAKLLFRKLRNILSIDENLTACRALQKVDTSNQCGFACARETDDAENLAILNVKRDILYGMYILVLSIVEGFYDMLKLNQIFILPFVSVRFLTSMSDILARQKINE